MQKTAGMPSNLAGGLSKAQTGSPQMQESTLDPTQLHQHTTDPPTHACVNHNVLLLLQLACEQHVDAQLQELSASTDKHPSCQCFTSSCYTLLLCYMNCC